MPIAVPTYLNGVANVPITGVAKIALLALTKAEPIVEEANEPPNAPIAAPPVTTAAPTRAIVFKSLLLVIFLKTFFTPLTTFLTPFFTFFAIFLKNPILNILCYYSN